MKTAISLPTLEDQAERLISLGLAERAGIPESELRGAAGAVATNGLLVIHPDRIPPSALTPLLMLDDKPGFVVVDMADVDDFAPIPQAVIPSGDLYLVTDIDRGDHLSNWTPNEALPEIVSTERTPLTLVEGIYWLLQQPDALQRGRCFMTIGSRLRRENGGLDARTPAIWISNGTGRDGIANKNAPKVGWCWAGNRHTWLGFASASARVPVGGL